MAAWFDDDKNLVILAVTMIALAFGYSHPEILDAIISGLFGVAIGKGMNNNTGGQ